MQGVTTVRALHFHPGFADRELGQLRWIEVLMLAAELWGEMVGVIGTKPEAD